MSQWVENLKARAAELQQQQPAIEVVAKPIAPVCWDEAAAAIELGKALTALDTATALIGPTPAQRNLLAVFRQLVTDWHGRRDPLLFGAAAWIEAHVDRWRHKA